MKIKLNSLYIIFLLSFLLIGVYLLIINFNSNRTKIPILMYHCTDNEISGQNSYLFVKPETFKEQMLTLKKYGYNTINYDDLIDFEENNKKLPKNPILITFDDGYQNNYDYGYQILKELNMKATIFVITGNLREDSTIGNQNFMTWDEAREMENSGLIKIESHTVSHKALGNLPLDEVEYELVNSKKLIEQHLNKICKVIALPNGSGNSSVVDIGKKSGYRVINFVYPNNVNVLKKDSLYSLKRIGVYDTYTGYELIKLLNAKMRATNF